MSHFPKLKTGAVAQYPASREKKSSTHIIKFLDGSDQRFREYATPIRRWILRLEALDTTEWQAVEDFFTVLQGKFSEFTFTDPWDGREYDNCSLDLDYIELVHGSDLETSTSLAIRHNRE